MAIMKDHPSIIMRPQQPTPPNPPEPLKISDGDDIKDNLGLLLLPLIGIISLICFHSFSSKKDVGLFIGLLFLFAIILAICLLIIIQEHRDYKQKRLDYKRALSYYEDMEKQYREDLESYPERLRQYELILSNDDYRDCLIRQFRQGRIQSRNRIDYEEISDKAIKKGKAEGILYSRLKELYPKSCFFNACANVESYEYTYSRFSYYPDIALIFIGLYIDIEIDEPYTIDAGRIKPIHFFSESSYESIDNKRNRLMTRAGWEVIRFSEEQVFCYTNECIHYIQDFISAIQETPEGFYYDYETSSLRRYSEEQSDNSEANNGVWKKKKWTEEDAVLMAEHRARDIYLTRINTDPALTTETDVFLKKNSESQCGRCTVFQEELSSGQHIDDHLVSILNSFWEKHY